MAHPYCEVFSYLNWDNMNRFLTDRSKHPAITKAYGSEEWRHVLSLEQKVRSDFMVAAYCSALRKGAGIKYVWDFAMADKADKLLYRLFFCTNNSRGLEEMKKAMWKVDPSGGFRFSDRDDSAQLNLFKSYDERTLAAELLANFAGREVRVSEIRDWVLRKTPAYKFKGALRILEKEMGSIKAVGAAPGRRRGAFRDDKMKVKFAPQMDRQKRA